MQYLTAGISALAVATNPVLISLLSVIFLGTRWTVTLMISLIICSLGVVCAAWPLLHTTAVKPEGLLLIFVSMLTYSGGALYFSSRQWGSLHLLTINGWQTLIGGVMLLPFALYFYRTGMNEFNFRFWYAVLWLTIPVSVAAVQLWMQLLKINPVKASFWLFLCPVSGFLLSAWLLNEKITSYTVSGTFLVIGGLAVAQSGQQYIKR